MLSYIKNTLCFQLFLFLLCASPNIVAQNNAEIDTSYAIGTFNGRINTMIQQTDGKIIVGGNFSSYKNIPVISVVRLNADGTLDYTFNTEGGVYYNPNINTLALQSDGKIIAGGTFLNFKGIAVRHIVRLNTDGSVDQTFHSGFEQYAVIKCIKVLPDDKMLVGGQIANYDNIAVNNFIRLNSDGTLDNSFNTLNAGTDLGVNTFSFQTDGKIVVGTNSNGAWGYTPSIINGIGRLNANGTIDPSFNVGIGTNNGGVLSIAIQSNGKIIIGGNFDEFNNQLNKKCIVRLNTDGSFDPTFVSSGVYFAPSLSLAINDLSILPNGKIIAAGIFGEYNGVSTNSIICINSDGSLDNGYKTAGSFNQSGFYSIFIKPDGKIVAAGALTQYNSTRVDGIIQLNTDGELDKSFNVTESGADGVINGINLQSDGKILINGLLNAYNNIPIEGLARINQDGTLDTTLNVNVGTNSTINKTLTQLDGKIIIVGYFTSYNGIPKNRIARLNNDGSLDNSFIIGSGADDVINEAALQSDGKILIAGYFNYYNGTFINTLIRLNSDGSIDNTFNLETSIVGNVKTISIQSDNKIIIAGNIYNGNNVSLIARINSDGSLDTTFKSPTYYDVLSGFGVFPISTSIIQPDGKIIIGGSLTNYNGTNFNHIIRLNKDGSVDHSFNTEVGPDSQVLTLSLQKDGKVLIGGKFFHYKNIPVNRLARLNTDGSLDNTFNIGNGILEYNHYVSSSVIQNDGKIIIAGSFNRFNNFVCDRIVRLQGSSNYFNTIRGNVFWDNNQDCIQQTLEKKNEAFFIKATPGPYYGFTNNDGKYKIVVDTGNVLYTLTHHYNSTDFNFPINQCATSHNVSINGMFQDTCCFDFADSLFVKECIQLNVNIQNSRMRRCFRGNTYVDYCNIGFNPASNTQIKITYPSHIIPINSVPMWTSKNDSILTYNIGTLIQNTCGKITITDSVSCGDESIRGLTKCIKAAITPISDCIDISPLWDRSSINVKGKCNTGKVSFLIQNIGAGHMNDSLEYRIFADDTLIFKANYKLNKDDSLEVNYLSGGQTIRLEADQSPLHPRKSRPRVTIENCKTQNSESTSEGLVMTAPLDDLEEEIAYTCNQIIDSYDPNDKIGMPKGIGITKQISPNQELEYIIRFQNTGTDIAYNVTIVDTLDSSLDIFSFVKGTSSHPYTFNLSGKGQPVLSFNFNNINLPDSSFGNVSNGLISFKISMPITIPLGTIIHNKAYIYFDYNSPILTNETIHTLGVDIPEDLDRGKNVFITRTVKDSQGTIKVYPNPTDGLLTIEANTNANIEIKIINILGIEMKSIALSGNRLYQIDVSGLENGLYIYEFWQLGERKETGMIQRQ